MSEEHTLNISVDVKARVEIVRERMRRLGQIAQVTVLSSSNVNYKTG